MTSGDALARLWAVVGCDEHLTQENGEPAPAPYGVSIGCAACASLLVTAIAAQVERETQERDAKTCEGSVSGNALARAIRALAPRYGGNPQPKESAT